MGVSNINANVVVAFGVPGGAAVVDFEGEGWIVPTGPDGETLNYELVRVVERHKVASSVANAEIKVKKAASGTALASGTDMLAGDGLETNGTANTNQIGTLATASADRRVASGDLVGLILDEAATSLDDVVVSLYFKGYQP